ncbi:hypothetical protein V5799_003314 [Amblyomma americanum]|uniref:DDE Tnp4 domain-containing protein n=1 Tax=Amblyomma americanum TaxID=6943 RepID=A0AAQ4D9B5_AMBAM
MRTTVSARTRLEVTLRFLASGESQFSLSRQFRLGHSTVNSVISTTCQAICDEFKAETLRAPKSEADWSLLAEAFRDRWQFPNCVGAIDGKHVAIVKPAKSGSLYFNYKKTFSIILFALVDADCKFLYLDVGAPGSKGDGAIWQTTPLQKAIACKKANMPDLVSMWSSTNLQLPPVLVGDDAFPLSQNLMKPFSGTQLSSEQKVFNYRLSRARRVSENAFGILAHRFRFLLTTVHAKPEKVTIMVEAACVIHNILKGHHLERPESINTGENPQAFFALQPCRSRPSSLAAAVRERLCDYFNGDGAVSWQNTRAGVDISNLRRSV